MLQERFNHLCKNFTDDTLLIKHLWLEIEEAYSSPVRHYHTLAHLEQIYTLLPTLDAVTEFAIFYHDIIYDVFRHDNEEQSALVCKEQLNHLAVPPFIIDKTMQLIRETKAHTASSSQNALFLDADLAILGSREILYLQYIKNVRQEYALFSDMEYLKGRKKVLMHFLEKERIYRSDYFYEHYEKRARENLQKELQQLLLN